VLRFARITNAVTFGIGAVIQAPTGIVCVEYTVAVRLGELQRAGKAGDEQRNVVEVAVAIAVDVG